WWAFSTAPVSASAIRRNPADVTPDRISLPALSLLTVVVPEGRRYDRAGDCPRHRVRPRDVESGCRRRPGRRRRTRAAGADGHGTRAGRPRRPGRLRGARTYLRTRTRVRRLRPAQHTRRGRVLGIAGRNPTRDATAARPGAAARAVGRRLRRCDCRRGGAVA